MFAVVQIWIVVADMLMVGGFQMTGVANLIFAALAFGLAPARGPGAQVVGTWLAWGLVAVMVVIRWI